MRIGTAIATFKMNVKQDFNLSDPYPKEVDKKFIHKYEYFQNGATVTCVVTHPYFKAIGIAKCNPKDEFNIQKGAAIAESRCKSDYYKQLALFL